MVWVHGVVRLVGVDGVVWVFRLVSLVRVVRSVRALISTWHPDWWHHASISVGLWWAGDHGTRGRGHWAPASTCNTILFIYN